MGASARRLDSIPGGHAGPISAAWQAALIRLAAVWAALLALFHGQWTAMADQWFNISTYNHVVLIPPIIGWLAWQRARGLLQLPPRGWWPGLIGLFAALVLWILGALAGLAEAQQAGAVAMLIAAVPTLLGIRVAAGLIFPLAYMAFLVPFGDEAVPFLQMLDARMTVALLHLSQVPAALDGVFITTPAGLFEIAEACSGVKFLVAMVAFGVLAANVCFVSWRRRLGLVAASCIVPVLANGVRSWGTIYVAQTMGARYAGGFDHIVYGWIFFAVVITGTIAAAWRFFDRSVDSPMIDAQAILDSPRLTRLARLQLGPAAALAAVLGLALMAQGWVLAAGHLAAPMPGQIDLPDVPGWYRAPYTPDPWWQPRGGGADHRLVGRYADGRGHVVDVSFALYAAQGPGRKADGYGEGAVRPDSGWAWQGPGPAVEAASSDRLQARGSSERLAETTYCSGDLLTGSKLALRLHVLTDKLLLRPEPTMMLILSAQPAPGLSAAQSIDAFRTAIGPIGLWMGQVAADRGHNDLKQRGEHDFAAHKSRQ
jgi:exosortase A